MRTRLGMTSSYFNGWLYSYGVDLLFDQGVDTNLRAALTLSQSFGPGLGRTVRFDPKADGINDYSYGDHDDWTRMSRVICTHARLLNNTFWINCPDDL